MELPPSPKNTITRAIDWFLAVIIVLTALSLTAGLVGFFYAVGKMAFKFGASLLQ